MEKRYQVFVSSTYRDLIDARAVVIKAILELGGIPAGMELFPATDDTQLELIKKVLASCDYYVLIVAGRYGSIHPRTGLSYTHLEYRYAKDQGIPTIAFLNQHPERLPLEKSETNAAVRTKLEEFRKEVDEKHNKYWERESQLDGYVSRSLYNLIQEHPRPGWVRQSQDGTYPQHRSPIELVMDLLKVFIGSLNALETGAHYRMLVTIAYPEDNVRKTLCGVNTRDDPDAGCGVPINFGVSGEAFQRRHRVVRNVTARERKEGNGLVWDQVKAVIAVPLKSTTDVFYGTLNADSTKSMLESGFKRRPLQDAFSQLAAVIGPILQTVSQSSAQ